IGHAFSRAFAQYITAMVNDLRGDFAGMHENADRLLLLAEERELPFWKVAGTGVRGRALAGQGHHAEGIRLMSTALELARFASAGNVMPYFQRHIADAYREMGSFDDSLRVIADGVETCRKHDNRMGESELHRMHGEILAAQGSGAAEESLRTSLRIAREQGASIYVRRSAASLASYLRARGRADEAEQLVGAR